MRSCCPGSIFLKDYFNAKDDEEKTNIIVLYIAYVVLAILSIFAIPALVAAGFSVLVAGLIVGSIAALVLLVIGIVFLVRRINRASEAKTPEDFDKETDQGANIIETTIVEIISSIVSGLLPPLGEKVPPKWRNKPMNWGGGMPRWRGRLGIRAGMRSLVRNLRLSTLG